MKMHNIEVKLSKDALGKIGELLEFFSDKHQFDELTRDDVIEMCIETTHRAFNRKFAKERE
jgi:hypothetical protein